MFVIQILTIYEVLDIVCLFQKWLFATIAIFLSLETFINDVMQVGEGGVGYVLLQH